MEDPKRKKKKRRKKHAESIIQKSEYRQRCYLCMVENGDFSEKADLETHHVMFGQNRREKSEADGLTVRLCRAHHYAVHHDGKTRQWMNTIAQRAWEKEKRALYGDDVRKMWRNRYSKNYLGADDDG